MKIDHTINRFFRQRIKWGVQSFHICYSISHSIFLVVVERYRLVYKITYKAYLIFFVINSINLVWIVHKLLYEFDLFKVS